MCVKVWIWFVTVGRCWMSVDEGGDDGGSGYHGLAEGPVLGRLMMGEKGDFGVRK